MRASNQKVYDKISPFEEFMRLFDTHRNNMFTMGSIGQFKVRAVLFLVFLTLFRFAFGNMLPSFVNIVLLIAVCVVMMEGILGFFAWFNKSAQKQGLWGAAKCFLGLIALMFIL